MTAMALSVAMAVFQFGVPIRGSLLVLFGASAIFLVGALAMGLLISTVTRNQFVAGQVAIVSGFLPAFMLSGFVFEIGSMPGWIQTRLMSWRRAISSRRFRPSSWPAIYGRDPARLGRHDGDSAGVPDWQRQPAPASGWTD